MSTLILAGLIAWATIDLAILAFCASATRLRRLNDARIRDAQHHGP